MAAAEAIDTSCSPERPPKITPTRSFFTSDKNNSGPSALTKNHLPGGASRLAALLIAHLCPISSLFAPCHPRRVASDPTGPALLRRSAEADRPPRNMALRQRGRATSGVT